MLQWMVENGEKMDVCVVGEPTNPMALGEMMKIGRRGSLNGWLTVKGEQGHTALSAFGDNPAHRIVSLLELLRQNR